MRVGPLQEAMERRIESEIEMVWASATRARNPTWSRDETILLLDLYLRVGRADPGHAEVLQLSNRLRQMALLDHPRVAETYRNAQGVAMKLKAMAQQDPSFRATKVKGLRAVGRDKPVWDAFAQEPDLLKKEVARIVARVIHAEVPSTTDRLVQQLGRTIGPPPSFGAFSTERQDSGCVIYLLRFDAPIAALFSASRVPYGWIVAKIGRTNDLARRVSELSAGLPPHAQIAWTVLDTVTYPTAGQAHDAEQALLSIAERKGWTLGGEFVVAPEPDLLAELKALASLEGTLA